MAATPSSSSEKDSANPAHHNPDGGRSMGRQTSSVTAPGFLSPVISGIRSGEHTSAIPLFLLSDDLEIVHGWPHVQVLEDPVLTVILREPRDAAVGIVQIAEHDRAGRTGLLARGADIPIPDRSAGPLRFDLRFLDALHAESTLLHDSARAHRDIGIEQQVRQTVFPRVVEPVEAARLVRAVVGAVARPPPAVIDLLIE